MLKLMNFAFIKVAYMLIQNVVLIVFLHWINIVSFVPNESLDQRVRIQGMKRQT